ncbi:hypothetical protein JL09_g6703 [Pichia kudriavzevii]|uniref:Uncharacterized protein n=1 Tax=Pichia kudriavzevii TaxID=4909 RepID=A0A099NJE4_PICKU|nr:hypothetical protein JL09_g6703 [Pichia kudriavzevii]
MDTYTLSNAFIPNITLKPPIGFAFFQNTALNLNVA